MFHCEAAMKDKCDSSRGAPIQIFGVNTDI